MSLVLIGSTTDEFILKVVLYTNVRLQLHVGLCVPKSFSVKRVMEFFVFQRLHDLDQYKSEQLLAKTEMTFKNR